MLVSLVMPSLKKNTLHSNIAEAGTGGSLTHECPRQFLLAQCMIMF